ncbi:Intermediate filament tail domain protein [Dirofilaria immitis]|nr:Intermediate filament tail domain protein [Dirofilaria immitis]
MSEYRSTISARPGYNRISTTTSSSTFGGLHPKLTKQVQDEWTSADGRDDIIIKKALTSGNRVVKVVTEMSSSSLTSGMSPFGQNAASTIRAFLEAQNRKLNADLDMLRGRWGKDTSSIKIMFEGELSEARKVINDTGKQRDELEKQIKKMQEELAEYRRKFDETTKIRLADRDKIDELLVALSNIEAEINLLRRRIALLEEEISRIKKKISDLDQETLNRIDYQNQVQTLQEEIDFIRRVQDQEIRDLQAMAARDTTSENREFFKMNSRRLFVISAMNTIRFMTSANRSDMESWYKLKVQEIQTQSARQTMEQGYQREEVKRLRVQLGDLRGKLADLEGRNSLLEKQIQELNFQLEDDQRSYEAALNDRDAQIRKMREECQALMVELQMLLDTKQTLDAEIAIYRKMLEGEGDGPGLKQLVEQVVRTTGINEVADTVGPDFLRIDLNRTAFIFTETMRVVKETSPDGKFIVLENTHRSKEESIGEWKLKRKIDGKREIVYTLPRDFILKPNLGRGQGGIHAPPEQLIFDVEESFGVGSNVQTILYNKEGEERATHIQRSSQTDLLDFKSSTTLNNSETFIVAFFVGSNSTCHFSVLFERICGSVGLQKTGHWYRYLPRRNDVSKEFNYEKYMAGPEHFPEKKLLEGSIVHQKKIEKLFGKDVEPGKMFIFKNTVSQNAELWPLKHIIEIRALSFPNGEPTIDDVNALEVFSDGRCIIDEHLACELSQLNVMDPHKQMSNSYLCSRLRSRYNKYQDIFETNVYTTKNVTLIE